MERSSRSVVRGGRAPSKRTTSRQVYSSPVAGSMASRRLGPSQCWKPRRCRSYSSPARAARMASGVEGEPRQRDPHPRVPGRVGDGSRRRRGAWRRPAGGARRRPGPGRARAETGAPRGAPRPGPRRAPSRRRWRGPPRGAPAARAGRGRRAGCPRSGPAPRRGAGRGRRAGGPPPRASRRSAGAGRGQRDQLAPPGLEHPLQVGQRTPGLGALGAEQLAGGVHRLDGGLVAPHRLEKDREPLRVGGLPDPGVEADLARSLGAAHGQGPEGLLAEEAAQPLVAEPEGGVGQHRRRGRAPRPPDGRPGRPPGASRARAGRRRRAGRSAGAQLPAAQHHVLDEDAQSRAAPSSGCAARSRPPTGTAPGAGTSPR